jgi:hypothetical protein
MSSTPKEMLDKKLDFNLGKYWLLLHKPKSPEKIKEIKKKCDELIKITRG